MDALARALVRVAAHALPRPVRPRYEREFSADLIHIADYGQQRAYAVRVLVRTPALRSALIGKGTQTMIDVDHKPLRCLIGLHHMVWFSTDDGGRWKHCDRCGTDWSGGNSMGWTYDMARRSEMGF